MLSVAVPGIFLNIRYDKFIASASMASYGVLKACPTRLAIVENHNLQSGYADNCGSMFELLKISGHHASRDLRESVLWRDLHEPGYRLYLTTKISRTPNPKRQKS